MRWTIRAFLKDFGSSRTATAAAFSIHMASYALGGWALGTLVDRLGARRVIAWSTATWVLALLLCGWVQELWQLYIIYGVVGGVATSGLAYVPNNTLLSRWFVRYRGMATGIAQAGVPLGTAVFGLLAQFGVTWVGWRWTHVGFGLVVAATALPLNVALLRDDPREKGLTPDGTPADILEPAPPSQPSRPLGGFTGSGLPRGDWTVFAANILRGMAMYAVLAHQVVYLVDAGYTRMAAASFFSLGSLVAMPAGLAVGVVSAAPAPTRASPPGCCRTGRPTSSGRSGSSTRCTTRNCSSPATGGRSNTKGASTACRPTERWTRRA